MQICEHPLSDQTCQLKHIHQNQSATLRKEYQSGVMCGNNVLLLLLCVFHIRNNNNNSWCVATTCCCCCCAYFAFVTTTTAPTTTATTATKKLFLSFSPNFQGQIHAGLPFGQGQMWQHLNNTNRFFHVERKRGGTFLCLREKKVATAFWARIKRVALLCCKNYRGAERFRSNLSKQMHCCHMSSVATERIKDLDKLNMVKTCNGGKVLASSQFLLLPQLPQITLLDSKVVKNDSKIVISLC